MASQVVKYSLDDGTTVEFEVDPVAGFTAAAADGAVVGRVQQAVEPAVQAARAVLDRVRQAGPDEVVVRFGVKVSGQANWWVAKAASEGSFEVELTWKPGATGGSDGESSGPVG